MVNARDEQPLTRLEVIVLAYAAHTKKLEEEELTKIVLELALPTKSQAYAREAALESLAALRDRGLVRKPRRTQEGSLGTKILTDNGKRVLRAVFGLPRAPTWVKIRDVHLPALALGFEPGTPQAKVAVSSADAIAATMLCAKLGIEQTSKVEDLCDVLIAEALGMSPGPLTIEKVRAHVLARRSGVDAKGDPEDIAKRAVVLELQSRGTQKEDFYRALGRRWVCDIVGAKTQSVAADASAAQKAQPDRAGPAPLAPANAPTPGAPVTPPPRSDDSAALLQMVREAIPRVGEEGRFGEEKVFVSALWRNMERERRLGDLSLDRFKRWLVKANRERWLTLVRADLVGAMDAKLVADSEIEDRGATFHFVIDPQWGAAASERRTHVR